jgi:hypothetical protein
MSDVLKVETESKLTDIGLNSTSTETKRTLSSEQVQ